MDRARMQNHLNRVSRSFAFCIERLEGELRDWVTVSYLLCRVLDTVEDSPWQSSVLREAAFTDFEDFLHRSPDSPYVTKWAKQFPDNIPAEEKDLLLDSKAVFDAFHQFPLEVQTTIKSTVLSMSRGMRAFLKEKSEGKIFRLHSIAELNQYCFFVAGIIGELLTNLLNLHLKGAKTESREDYRNALHFGLFLQKVNILKDQLKDEQEGRYLVPSRKAVLTSLATHADGAIRYILSIPVAERGYRLFCAWSLFLGLSSLTWFEKGMRLNKVMKLPRLVTSMLLGKVERLIDSNDDLYHYFQKLNSLQKSEPVELGAGVSFSLTNCYFGNLLIEDRQSVGVLV
ncbi:MAG: squalene/phytoene synthase family protein [Oligoflexia bacterium]|nr:squalene/phytoene synthase family protein [Oligoflexia bacterium]